MDNTTTPLSPKPQTQPVATPPMPPPTHQTAQHANRTLLIILGILLFVLVTMFAILAYKQSTNTPVPAPVYPTSAPITVTPPSEEVSDDDSIDVMQEEVDETQVEDFSEEQQEIQQDVEQL